MQGFYCKQDLENLNSLNIVTKSEKYFKSKIDILINNSGGPDPKLIIDTEIETGKSSKY